MAVFIMDPIADEAVQLIARHHEVVNYPESRQRDWHAEAHALIVRTFQVREPDFAAAHRLKIVAKHGSGVDNIDIREATRSGVLVTNTPGANANAVAEYVLALTLSVARRVAMSDRTLRAGKWQAAQDGIELTGKRLGLIGLGDIGARTSRLFKAAFNADVIAYDPYADDQTFASVGAIRAESMEEVFSSADVVSLHVPLIPETRHLVNRRLLGIMKPSAILVNVARGGIVDETALYDALRDRQLAGAASDVFEQEPFTTLPPLLQLDTFVASPHIGGSSRESLLRMGSGAANAVIEALAGRVPAHLITPKA